MRNPQSNSSVGRTAGWIETRLINWFVPTNIEPIKRRQAQLFVLGYGLGPILAYVFAFFLWRLETPLSPAYWTFLAVSTGFFAFPVALRVVRGAFDFLAIISVLYLTAVILFMVYNYGGYTSPAIPATIVVPVAAFYFLRSTGRVICMAFLVAGSGTLLFLHFSGHSFPQRVPYDSLRNLLAITVLITAVYVAVMTWSLMALFRGSVEHLQEEFAKLEKSDEKLRRSQETLRLFMNSAADSFGIFDKDLNLVDTNEAGTQARGVPKEELVGKNLAELLPESVTSGRYKEYLNVIRTGETYHFEFSTVLPNRTSETFYSVSAFKVGEGIGILSHDVTSRKAAEEEIRQHQAELARVLRMGTMGEMASSLAHEVNQPLAAIYNFSRGCLRRLTSGKSSPSEFRPALEQISEQAERASAIVLKIADFVRKGEQVRVSTNPNELVHSVARLASAELRVGRVKFELELGDLLPAVDVDRIEIEQVLLNIVRNSIEAMQETPPGDRTLVVVTHQPSDDEIEITVRDTGPGLPDLASDIFEAFFTTKQGGMGMGLAISRTIMDAHGGRLWAEPGARCGVMFHITLPVSPVGNTSG